MTFAETFEQLRALGSEQTRKTYRRHGAGDNLFGVSFAALGQLKKEFVGRGKDKTQAHELARQLWQTQNIDAQLLATMIADPARLTEAEARAWVADCQWHCVSDSLASLICQTPFAEAHLQELQAATAPEQSQRVGYAILSRLAQLADARPDVWFLAQAEAIEPRLHQAPNRAKEAMNTALIAIGGRSEELRQHVEHIADRLGPVSIDHGDTACQTFEIKPYLAKIWARKHAVKA